ncbi:MAG: hypothetical protein A2Y10_09675 [Planctomycetes bacterium GWF2_41_51]|nr:MAG: hypothetical protein A2Y10_09675 [Planctomycetes bacterium GWF2_41_51]HBG28258.1 hypothetical protein [Phycisphaerales bacterium]
MAENKFGLHKQVTAIFDGIPLPTKSIICDEDTSAVLKRSTDSISSFEKDEGFGSASSELPKIGKETSILQQVSMASEKKVNQFKFKGKKIEGLFSSFKLSFQDRRQAIMLGVTLLLSLVLIFLVSKGSNSSKGKRFENVDSKAELIPQIKWQVPDYLSDIRDPMQIGSGTKGKTDSSDLIVKGIVYSDDAPSLVINGLILGEGQKISGVKILKIYTDGVELEKDGKTWIQKVQ